MKAVRLLAAAGLVLAALVVPVARGTAAILSSPQPSCNDVLFVGVRGSGETATQESGYGPEVAAIRNSFVQHLPTGVTFRDVPIDYAAAPVLVLLNPFTAFSYLDSIVAGENKLRDALSLSWSVCHGTQQWVVAGYSQGALVVNQVMREYASYPNIAAILLVGDPARVPNQVGAEYGTALPGYGVLRLLGGAVHLTPLPPSFGPVTVNLCDAGDPVCDWSHRGNPHHVEYVGYPLHVTYESRDPGLLDAIGFAAVRNLYRATVAQQSGPLGFFTTASSSRACPPGSELLVDVGGSDPGWYFTGPGIVINTEAFASINRRGIFTIHLSCRIIPGGVNVESLAQALALQEPTTYPDVRVTINAPRQTATVTPRLIVANRAYQFSFAGTYRVSDGTGLATAFLCDSTGDLFAGTSQAPTPLGSGGGVHIVETLGAAAAPPGGLFACLAVTYDNGAWGFQATPVPITLT